MIATESQNHQSASCLRHQPKSSVNLAAIPIFSVLALAAFKQ
jgi:hypothetical protein